MSDLPTTQPATAGGDTTPSARSSRNPFNKLKKASPSPTTPTEVETVASASTPSIPLQVPPVDGGLEAGSPTVSTPSGKKKSFDVARAFQNLMGMKKSPNNTHNNTDNNNTPKSTPTTTTVMATPKTPKWEFVNNRDWIIANFTAEQEIKTLEDSNFSHGAQVLNCENFKLDVKSKMNSLTIDSCKKTNVQFTTLIGSLSVINCQQCNIQCTGVLPSITIDNSSNIQVYLTNESRGVSIATSMTGTVNVLIPPVNGGPDDDLVEMAIPGQFIHEIQGDKIVSKVSDLYR